jgi:hypothetical protein
MADVATQTKSFLSGQVAHFTESVIREMTRKAMMYDAVNLAQGFPDFPAPAEMKRAAQEAIAADINQYAITWGAKSLRNAIARKFQEWQGMTVDPETELTVCCGSNEAIVSTLLAGGRRLPPSNRSVTILTESSTRNVPGKLPAAERRLRRSRKGSWLSVSEN